MSTQLLERLNYIRYAQDFGFEFQSRSPNPCQTDERIVNFIRCARRRFDVNRVLILLKLILYAILLSCYHLAITPIL